jgi:pimeloyl-ACP methyl ester carboxylesterase
VTRARTSTPNPPSARSRAVGTIVFAHANGFPASVYRVLFEAWRAQGYAVHAIERFGQDPAYPVTNNWPHLRDQLIDFIERRVGAPAWLVGHSLGGIVSILAAAKRPDLARGVVLLDSPLIEGWRAHALRMAKATGLIQRITPVRVARNRRHGWPTRAAVREHFIAKRAFARWDPRVLDDYIASGFRRRGTQTVLAIERELEARIYTTLPHHVGPLLRRYPLRCRLAFVGGRQSLEARQSGLAATRRLAGDLFVWTEGSHLFPMEHPDATAAIVVDLIARVTAQEASVPSI